MQSAAHVEKILLVDDVPGNLAVLTSALEPEGYEILAVPNGATALKVTAKAQPSLILLDIIMPEMDGLETCRRLKQNEATRDIVVIFITARGEMESVVEGFRTGGLDYIIKPFQADEVLSRVKTHLRLNRLTRELLEKNHALEIRTAELTAEMQRRERVENELRHADHKLAAFSDLESARGNLAGMVGGSGQIKKIIEEIRRLHQFANTSVLITGESGTGKELVARAIHFGSTRAKAPFVPVNCVAIPAELAESILFGHVKGAFTGATADRKGCFELADGGTLFLDEIGDMPVSLQVKLLRVLEDGCVTPVGGAETRRVDVRVGDIYTLEWAVSKTVVNGIDVGLTGYYQQQVTDIEGPTWYGPTYFSERVHVAGIGPERLPVRNGGWLLLCAMPMNFQPWIILREI